MNSKCKGQSLLVLFCLSAFVSLAQAPSLLGSPLSGLAAEETGLPAQVKPPTTAAQKSATIRIPRFTKAPAIDGKLEPEHWQQAVVLKDFYQIQPGDNVQPSRATELLLGYNSEFLFVAFRAYDDVSKIRTTISKRDAIFDDDHVYMLLDTFNDQRRAYMLGFNPLGIQADGIHTEGVKDTDLSVDILMESKGELTSDGYTVEVAIPFKSLRYEAGKDKVWGVHFFRRIKRFDNELNSWMPISRDASGLLNQAGHITGIEGVSSGRALEIIPSLAFSETGRRVRALPASALLDNPDAIDPGRFVNPPLKSDPGLTVSLGISADTRLDFTLNPDFAQIEADETVITANQRFPIFFTEKRPFFLEGIDIFKTPLQPVHTRAIIDPDYAVKLTGKRGPNTFAVLLASDNAPGNFSEEERSNTETFKRIARFLDKNAQVGVLRLKRDVGKENYVGVTLTSYNFIEKKNQLGGFDGRFRLDPQTVVIFEVIGTTSRRFFFDPEQGGSRYRTGNGFGYFINYNKTGRYFGLDLVGEGRTRDYVADVGFTRRANTNFVRSQFTYNSEPHPKAKLINWRLANSTSARFDWQGRMQSWFSSVNAGVSLRRQTFFNIGVNNNYERLFEEEFGSKRTPSHRGAFSGDDPERSSNEKSLFSSGGTTPGKQFAASYNIGYNWGTLDLDRGAGPRFPRVSPVALLDPRSPLDPGPGNTLNIRANLTYQPTNALRASLSYTRSRLIRNDTRLVAFDDHIYSLRTTYQFTRFSFARARIDYSTMLTRAQGQFLVGWTPNPGTSFYAGYNDDVTYNGFSPVTGRLEPGFRRNRRTFFIKMSYLIRRNM